MTGAMYAAIAGLRTHMQNLNVIGNNVANVNTYGYKSARSVFKTSLYTSLNGGSNGTTVMGGVNPSQIGYGATMGSVGIDMSTGQLAITGKSSDLMIDGDGFFMLGEKTTASQFRGTGADQTVLNGMTLTRVGDVGFGPDGYLANNDGYCVYGFLVDYVDPDTGEPHYCDQLVPIRLPGVRTVIDDTTTPPTSRVEIVYPTKGGTDYPGTEGGNLTDRLDPDSAPDGGAPTAPYAKADFMGITFDKNTGIISGTSKDTGELVTIGIVAIGQVKNPNGVTNLGDNYYQAGEGSGGLSVSLLGGAAQSLFGNASDPAGTAYYMNRSLNADADDGMADVCRLRSGGKTRLLSNGLEMSKTDLAQEISQMILTQRGYQANTRVITVTDSMLEELVNMKR